MAEGRWLPWKEQKMDIRPFPGEKFVWFGQAPTERRLFFYFSCSVLTNRAEREVLSHHVRLVSAFLDQTSAHLARPLLPMSAGHRDNQPRKEASALPRFPHFYPAVDQGDSLIVQIFISFLVGLLARRDFVIRPLLCIWSWRYNININTIVRVLI